MIIVKFHSKLTESQHLEVKLRNERYSQGIDTWFLNAQVPRLNPSILSPPTLDLTSAKQLSSKCSTNAGWRGN